MSAWLWLALWTTWALTGLAVGHVIWSHPEVRYDPAEWPAETAARRFGYVLCVLIGPFALGTLWLISSQRSKR